MKESSFKVWITKHALTFGIEEKEVEFSGVTKSSVVVLNQPYRELFHGEGKEWHKTKESAIKRAEEMRIKKIASLEKQIEKLKELKFE